ncbi:MAG: RNA 2',3'-cyclic phosphodiesterase [Ktedonobacterales bacterium]|nr:RNA 2',3'-cyclic phosphodiesterase [Ktedonobacterales bacterium]
MTRTFIALELSDEVHVALRHTLERLARALPAIHWVDAASLHLTLAFLGELDDARLAAVTEATELVVRGAVPLRLEVVGMGTFGSERAPRVIWAGIGGHTHQLLVLREELVQALEARGFAREALPFSPHLTLARVKDRLDDATHARLRSSLQSQYQVKLAGWETDHLAVMKSELARPAARYTRLRVCGFGGDARP